MISNIGVVFFTNEVRFEIIKVSKVKSTVKNYTIGVLFNHAECINHSWISTIRNINFLIFGYLSIISIYYGHDNELKSVYRCKLTIIYKTFKMSFEID